MKKGTQLLEVYALEIQMYTVQKNNKKLKKVYEQSLHIKSAIPHPFTMGVIRGKSSPFATERIFYSGHKVWLTKHTSMKYLEILSIREKNFGFYEPRFL